MSATGQTVGYLRIILRRGTQGKTQQVRDTVTALGFGKKGLRNSEVKLARPPLAGSERMNRLHRVAVGAPREQCHNPWDGPQHQAHG